PCRHGGISGTGAGRLPCGVLPPSPGTRPVHAGNGARKHPTIGIDAPPRGWAARVMTARRTEPRLARTRPALAPAPCAARDRAPGRGTPRVAAALACGCRLAA